MVDSQIKWENKEQSKQSFLAKVITFTFAIIMLSSVRLSVVCNVRVPYTQAIEIFGNVFMPFGTLAICDFSIKILRRSSQGNPTLGGGG